MSIYYISTSDFVNGPYIIDKSGTYNVTSDIVFTSTQVHDYIIKIAATDVILDLNSYTISQSNTYAYYSRYLSIVQVDEVPEMCKPSTCGTHNNVTIRNGTLTRCSYAGIRTLVSYVGDVHVCNVTFKNYETSGIYSEHKGKLYCNDINISNNLQEWRMTINYDYARKLIQTSMEISRYPSLLPSYIAILMNAVTSLQFYLDGAAMQMIDTGVSIAPWSSTDMYQTPKYVAGIYSTSKLQIKNSETNGIKSLLDFNYSIIDNNTQQPVLDPSGSNIRWYVFMNDFGTDVLSWSSLITSASNIARTYMLPYPYVPLDIINSLFINHSLLPSSYSYLASLPKPIPVIYCNDLRMCACAISANDINSNGIYSNRANRTMVYDTTVTCFLDPINLREGIHVEQAKHVGIKRCRIVDSIIHIVNYTHLCMVDNTARSIVVDNVCASLSITN